MALVWVSKTGTPTPREVDENYPLPVSFHSSDVLPGVQYTEGDTDASITGTAFLWEDAADTLRSVSAAKPLPVSNAALATLTGAVNETAPATDTASSGLNGRLQRIAQRITSLIALFPTALGQAAMAASLPVVLSSDQAQVPATPDGIVFRPTITTTAVAYTANDGIGGIITLASVPAASGLPVRLRSIVLKDSLNQKPALQVLFFRATPAGGTYTDNAAAVLDASDLADLVYTQVVGASDWVTLNGQTLASACYGHIDVVLGPAATSLFMLIITSGTPTYGADGTSLMAEIGFERLA